MNSVSNQKTYLEKIPNDVLGYIYSFDSTYSDKLKLVLSHLHKLKRRENYIKSEHFVHIIDYSHDAMIVSDSPIISSPTPLIPDLNSYFYKSTNSLISRKQEPVILNDNAYIVLENMQAYHRLLRSNLLREYDLDGWGLDIYSTEDFDFIDNFMSI
tara:strand:- start:1012 stop:1479 length:468 start_codon:yes stop_codon:yes gene_type:complete